MLPRLHCLFLALATALLIIVGSFGIYSVEASSFRGAIREAQSYDTFTPIEAYEVLPGSSDLVSIPGLPF